MNRFYLLVDLCDLHNGGTCSSLYQHYTWCSHQVCYTLARPLLMRPSETAGKKLNFYFRGLLFTSHWLNLQYFYWTGFYIAVYGNFQGLFFDFRGLFFAFRGRNRPEPPCIFFSARLRVRVLLKTPIPDRNSKTGLWFVCTLCAKYALRAIRKVPGLNRRWNNWETQYTVRKCFYLENKIPIQSQWPKPHFLPSRCSMQVYATSVKLRLRALSIQKRICTAWVRQIEERVKITAQVGRPYLRKYTLCRKCKNSVACRNVPYMRENSAPVVNSAPDNNWLNKIGFFLLLQ